jgi:cytochrome P450 family 10
VDIIMGNAIMSRFGQHYKDAGDYVPERWLRGGEMAEKVNPFVTLPFGHGARKCIGMRFALLEMELVSAKVKMLILLVWKT